MAPTARQRSTLAANEPSTGASSPSKSGQVVPFKGVLRIGERFEAALAATLLRRT